MTIMGMMTSSIQEESEDLANLIKPTGDTMIPSSLMTFITSWERIHGIRGMAMDGTTGTVLDLELSMDGIDLLCGMIPSWVVSIPMELE